MNHKLFIIEFTWTRSCS